ncbi:SDR family oxidoreductase [Mucilaginibacter phyllosphaerae]|uniref:NADP-dependent 3-hydroxy acid dehydrogenase YdfG n=1 Tax=Mucilaginibacter phyllosphaerae TaxID=1812349 RepID=A0A4Y8ACH1_9SPHI|nr:SDR family oxidoreductase [Mucilaginibacter phyllosphaerae]MBB3969478.1 NADP-dependent 3-hydroxy acid dehydrogenase YdfG [Mucilaginibacter phyllosphaerae]TEW65742.1 SDR family oxidoreductase [Mucilaginibacter phyllosphaerae]GGH08861.1 clavaldehyde dehydrogenase [Mucilaginibacter phyllosphaerae]
MNTADLDLNTPAQLNGMGVMITGGTTGIGRATAILLAQKGADVLIVGNSQDHLDDTLNSMQQAGLQSRCTGIKADLATADGIQQIFTKADEVLGKVDVLINNAALAHQDVNDGNYEDWERVIKTNLLGYIACTSYAVDRMAPNGRGHIVNVGSMSADVREKGSSVYVATKAGIQGFSEALRKEINEQGIKVTLIEPGAVGTDMQPAAPEEQQQKQKDLEMLTAEDIAAAIVYALEQPLRCDVVELKLRPHLQII